MVAESGDGVAFEPLGHDLRRCANAAITERQQTLIVDGEQGCSYQAMLALGALADAPEFPGATAEALFAPLEAVGFPVDAAVHARWLGNRQALAQVRKRIADVEHAYHEQVQGAVHGPACSPGRIACSRASTRRSCRPAGTRRCCMRRSASLSAPAARRSWSAASPR